MSNDVSIFFCTDTYPRITERTFGHLLSDVTVCILNFVFIVIGITANVLAILAYKRTKRLQTPSNYILVILSTFDVLLAVTGQPLLIIWKVMELAQMFSCTVYIATVISVHFVSAISLIITSFLISLERYFSVFHPVLHRKHANKYFIRILVALIVFTWALFLTASFIGNFQNVYFATTCTLVVTCLLGTLIGYTRIFREISRRCTKRDTVASTMINHHRVLTREKTIAVNIIFIVGTMTVFYAPIGGCAVYVLVNGLDWLYMNYFVPWAYVLVFASTAINPFLYGWKNRALRRSINSVLRRAFEAETDV